MNQCRCKPPPTKAVIFHELQVLHSITVRQESENLNGMKPVTAFFLTEGWK